MFGDGGGVGKALLLSLLLLVVLWAGAVKAQIVDDDEFEGLDGTPVEVASAFHNQCGWMEIMAWITFRLGLMVFWQPTKNKTPKQKHTQTKQNNSSLL